MALVTGAARGIGRAVALRLAGAGADVCVADLRLEAAESVADDMRRLGRRAAAVAGDVATNAGRRACLDAAEALGPVDVLVNNAGILHVAPPLELTEADWDRVFDVNAKSTFFMSQLVLPGMIERRRGAIVNLASSAGKLASGVNQAHYNASKAAVIALTKTLSQFAAPHGVRVNCVCPGRIDTDMLALLDRDHGQARLGLPPGEFVRRGVEQVPMGRPGTADEVAAVILFLASPLAAYMTGQAVNVTGGWLTV